MEEEWSCSICLEETLNNERLEMEIYAYDNLKYFNENLAKQLIQHLITITQHSLLSCTFELACKHRFHMKCIIKVYNPQYGTVKCPNCRSIDSMKMSKTFQIFQDLNTLMLATRIIASRFKACETKLERIFQYPSLVKNSDMMVYQINCGRLTKSFQNIYQLIQEIAKNIRKYNESSKVIFILDDHLEKINKEMNLEELFKLK